MSDFMDQIEKAIGSNDSPSTVKSWLNTGHPLLNDAISGSYHGGMPVGRQVEIYGPSSSGKTAIANECMVSAQKAGGVAMFFDHERSFDHRLAVTNGLNIEDRWVFKKPDTFEQSIGLAAAGARSIRDRKLIPPDAPIIVVFDSLAAMVPMASFEKGMEERNMNDTTALARATAGAFPKLSQFCEMYGFTALFLNQVRTKVGVTFGDPTTTPGGSSMEFFASVRIALSRSQNSKGSGDAKEITGQTITANVKKNKVHRPFEKAKWDFVFTEEGNGVFDPVGSVIDVLLTCGALEKSGNYIIWDGKKKYRQPLIDEINAAGERGKLFSLLPRWKDDLASNPNHIEWDAAA